MKTRTIIALLVLGVLLRVFMAHSLKGWVCDDERAHWTYAKYVSVYQGLPTYSWSKNHEHSDSLGYTYEYYQQPAYYVLAAPFAALGFDGPRYLSIALTFAAMLFLVLVGRCGKEALAFWFLPGVVLVTMMTTNQALMLFGVGALCHALKRDNVKWLVAVCVLLALTKITGVVIVLALLFFRIVNREPHRIWEQLPGLAAGLMFLIPRWYLSSVNAMMWDNRPMTIWYRLVDSIATGVFGPITTTNIPVYALLIAVPVLLLLGVWWWHVIRPCGWNVYAVCGYAVVATWLLFSVTHVFGQGRLLYAAVPFFLMQVGSQAPGEGRNYD